MTDARHVRGEELLERVLGQVVADSEPMGAPHNLADLRRLLVEHTFGDSWSRPGLDLRAKSIATIAVLAVVGSPAQQRAHLRGALRLGITKDELVELIIHVAVYAGAPRASELLKVALDLFEEQASS
jgi:4-carboxymuconolactone decarboxylase